MYYHLSNNASGCKTALYSRYVVIEKIIKSFFFVAQCNFIRIQILEMSVIGKIYDNISVLLNDLKLLFNHTGLEVIYRET